MIDPAEQVERGRQAAELMDHPILSAALDAIEAEVVSQWAECPARDNEGKEALWQLLKTSKKFRAILTGYINSGKLSSENMKRFEEKRGLRAVFGR